MLNYSKILVRNLVKRRVYSVVNVLGLAIGITSFILIMLYVQDELSFDRYHRKADRIYRLCMVYDFGGVGENSASMPFPVAFTLKGEYPDMIRETVRIFNFQSNRHFLEYGDKKFNETRFFFADSTFFSIFDHRFLAGDPSTALNEPLSVVMTASSAKRYFGDEDPMGKFIRYETGFPLKVTGVIEDVPAQSHFTFDFLTPMSTVRKMFKGNLPKTWVWNPCWTYLLLADGVNPDQLAANLPAFTRNFFYDAQKESVTLYLQKLTDIHLHSRLDYEIEPNGTHSYIMILSVIACFLLIIASINFMNLATATAASRAKEIGIRKVTGAQRMQLIIQFLGESLIMTLLAFTMALIMIELTLPFFNDYTGKAIQNGYPFQGWNLLAMVGLWLFLGLMSGAYPAFYLSSFRPISVLRGVYRREGSSGIARKALVVFQFMVSIGLIICTLLIFSQVRTMRKADLGFNPRNIIMLPVLKTMVAEDYHTFKDKVLQYAGILSLTAVDDIVGASHNTHEFRHEGMTETEWRFYPALVVKEDFLKTFDIRLAAGRDYEDDNSTDPMNGILINESMIKHLGWPSNEAALGKKFRSIHGEERVIGVFRDFQPRSLHEASGPFALNMKESPAESMFFLKYLAIRTTGMNHPETIAFLSRTWEEFEPERPFDYFFLEDELGRLYKDETNLGILSLIFTILILFVAILGLFGLASFMAEKRTKEMGIRKVMGAGTLNILVLLQKEFALLILIATVIAWPIAFYIMEELFLAQFTVRAPFNIWIFVLSGLFALLISMIIISYRAIMVSRVNPAQTLKYE